MVVASAFPFSPMAFYRVPSKGWSFVRHPASMRDRTKCTNRCAPLGESTKHTLEVASGLDLTKHQNASPIAVALLLTTQTRRSAARSDLTSQARTSALPLDSTTFIRAMSPAQVPPFACLFAQLDLVCSAGWDSLRCRLWPVWWEEGRQVFGWSSSSPGPIIVGMSSAQPSEENRRATRRRSRLKLTGLMSIRSASS